MKKNLLLLFTTFIFAQPGYDCNGELNGPALPDDCGICTGGDNSCITYNQFLGCDGVCFSGKEVDDCGVCNLDSDLLNLGDLNNDNDINVTDIVIIVSTIFTSNFNTIADMDGNCTINVGDIVAIIDLIIFPLLYSNDPASMTPNQTRTTIQAAIQLASDAGKDLLFEHPDLTYTIDGTIFIPSDIKIDFNNSIIRREGGEAQDDVFDMLTNENLSGGNVNIVLKNLIIDGNRENDTPNVSSDDLTPYDDDDRFSGLKFSNVSDSKLMNITVEYTTNGEQRSVEEVAGGQTPAGGIFFTNGCNNIYCKNINAYYNDYTGIIIQNSTYITIDGSFTSDNTGSGIGSQNADYCSYYRITSENNGHKPSQWNHNKFSNISINGECSVAYDLTTSSATGSGLNIGHPNDPANADFSIVKKVDSFDNALEGITIRNADYVQLSDLTIKNNKKNNIKIQNDYHDWDDDGIDEYYDASNIRIKNSSIFGYYAYPYDPLIEDDYWPYFWGGYGLRIQGLLDHESECGGHIIDGTAIYNNWYNGIGVINLEGDCGPNSMNASVWVGINSSVYNNGRADEFETYEGGVPGHIASGIRLDESENSEIHCPTIYCDEDIDNTSYDGNVCSQDHGIHILGGDNHTISVWDISLIQPTTPPNNTNTTYNTCTPR